MKVEIGKYSLPELEADWVVCGVWDHEDRSVAPDPLRPLLDRTLAALRSDKLFVAKRFEVLPLVGVAGMRARNLLLVGLGKPAEHAAAVIFRAASAASRFLLHKANKRVAFALTAPPGGEISPFVLTRNLAGGAIVGSVGQDLYQTEKKSGPIETLLLVDDGHELDHAVAEGTIIGEAVNSARELVNLSPAELYPETFCSRAQTMAEAHAVETEAWDVHRLTAERMRCILAVGGGSSHEPRLLILNYRGGGPDRPTYAFVGKGITFDSGGLSLKSADNMKDMKCDMAGAAAMLAATIAAARLKFPINLTTLCPLAENMPSAASYRVGDVLTARNGKTIEIQNTDAEGRLVLADALSLAVEQGVCAIVDAATLTGACMVALGMDVAGLMTNDEAWGKRVAAAAERAGELVWPLPMFPEYDELIKSTIADIKNVGGRWGGAITAGKFLAEFVGKTPWVHVDIAGPAFAEKATPYLDAGGTGFLVRTLIELARELGS